MTQGIKILFIAVAAATLPIAGCVSLKAGPVARPVSAPAAGTVVPAVKPPPPGRKVMLYVPGFAIDLDTAAGTVRDLLVSQGVPVGHLDRVEPGLDQAVVDGMSVRVVRRVEYTEITRAELPFDTERRGDEGLLAGETRVLQAGEPGTLETTRKQVLEDGQLVLDTVVADVKSPPIPRVVAYGTVNTVARGGRTYRFNRVHDMVATGYTAGKESNPDGDGTTFTGRKAVPGIAAVDPKVIPLHTRLYVDGYGPAQAEDIGGAIAGQRIDLVFGTVSEALRWGVRPVRVYVLSDD